ncbi:hypothetical protein OZ401_005094 (plasmid) [Candidatus Chlorohelix allophototropha]|uniref:Uncharacterized protein n=1 Tax=Candidatus Chlorohelix allophototropha TaxID=3003348 RepID=A0ABY9BCP2_9CHLR|nr:hypothetical protein OZ401_005094 [Chloroflexota bacterium L227-S17]
MKNRTWCDKIATALSCQNQEWVSGAPMLLASACHATFVLFAQWYFTA